MLDLPMPASAVSCLSVCSTLRSTLRAMHEICTTRHISTIDLWLQASLTLRRFWRALRVLGLRVTLSRRHWDMQPAYAQAGEEPAGSGVKRRILDIIIQHAKKHAPALFINMRQKLTEG